MEFIGSHNLGAVPKWVAHISSEIFPRNDIFSLNIEVIPKIRRLWYCLFILLIICMARTLNCNYVVSSRVEKTTVFASIVIMRRFRHYSLLMDKSQATHSHLRWGYWKQPVWNGEFHRLLLHFLAQNSSPQDDLRIYFPKACYEPSCSWGPSVSPYWQGSHWGYPQDSHLQRQLPDRTLTSWLRGKKNHTASVPEKNHLQVEYVRHLLKTAISYLLLPFQTWLPTAPPPIPLANELTT